MKSYKYVCNVCGAYFNTDNEAINHVLDSCYNGYSYKQVQTGTTTLPAVTEQRWVSNMVWVPNIVETQVLTGYVCSECGASQ